MKKLKFRRIVVCYNQLRRNYISKYNIFDMRPHADRRVRDLKMNYKFIISVRRRFFIFILFFGSVKKLRGLSNTAILVICTYTWTLLNFPFFPNHIITTREDTKMNIYLCDYTESKVVRLWHKSWKLTKSVCRQERRKLKRSNQANISFSRFSKMVKNMICLN